VALDLVAGTLTFYKNGVSQGVAYSGLRGTFYPATGNNTTSQIGSFNFGQRPFYSGIPSGFNAINTYNNPVTTTWWGNGNTYPDLTWIKSRSATTSHMLMDTLRGPGTFLSSNNANQQWGSGGAYNWSKYGLVLANDGNTNVAGNTYVLWGWTAGQGNAVVNSYGTITATVSANPTAGFSIASYTGNGVFGATIGHGLGVTPSMIIVKGLQSNADWPVWHTSLTPVTGTQWLDLQVTDSTYPNRFNSTLMNSTVWGTGSQGGLGSEINNTGANYIAYAWTAVPGYSAFGSYVGNGSTDGPFIYTGFRPRFIMIKLSSAASYHWTIMDTARDPYNVSSDWLFPDLTAADTIQADTLTDILSNGFKPRTVNNNTNGNTNTYIYAAFAENPFKYALAR
jgi:hypothetical protein